MDAAEELLQVSADAFHRLNGNPSSNSDVRLWRFWREVALRLGQLEYQRARSARRVARYVILVRHIAETWEARTESLKREIENRDYVAEIYQAQIEALKASEQHWHANAVQMMDERDLWKAKAKNE